MTGIRFRLSLALISALVAALAFLSSRTADRAEALLAPELTAKAEAVARSTAGLVARAEAFGIPADRLVGLDRHLAARLASNAELAWIALLDSDGRPLAEAGVPSGVIGARTALADIGSELRAVLAVDLSPEYSRGVVLSLWIDLAIIIVVTALVAVELLYISFGPGLYGAILGLDQRLRAAVRGDLHTHPAPFEGSAAPPRGAAAFLAASRSFDARIARLSARVAEACEAARTAGDAARRRTLEALRSRHRLGESGGEAAGRVIAVRAPLFVFMFAEELSRPFLPLYIEARGAGAEWIDPSLVIGLPMMVFLLIVALSQPVLGPLAERAGHRRALIAGAGLGAAGHAATALAPDLVALTLARAVTAVGFALVFAASQGFVIGAARGAQRASGMAVFIGAILVAGVCGPPIGGLLADRVGMEATFLAAAGLAATSLWMAALALSRSDETKAVEAAPGPPPRLRDAAAVLGSARLSALTLLCAFPAKAALVALCFYLTPVHMAAMGHDQATAGRMLMIYPIVMVALVPVFAGFADRPGRQVTLVGAGGVAAGGGALIPLIDPDSLVLHGTMLLLFGFGQAMSIAAQSALVGALGRGSGRDVSEPAVYGLFRLVERLGSAAGPVLAAVLLASVGFASSSALIGAAVIAGALAFLAVMAACRGADEPPPFAGGGRPAR